MPLAVATAVSGAALVYYSGSSTANSLQCESSETDQWRTSKVGRTSEAPSHALLNMFIYSRRDLTSRSSIRE